MLAVLDRPGAWRWAGMSGVLAGLDLAQALASLPAGCDLDFACRLLIEAEVHFVAAWWQANAPEKEDRTDGKPQ
ncbi:MAG: hypothetical protein AB7V13_23735 [Pseudorhodoplanes sp.]|uniref:hypothetical protein n=1 Tax=Pseudorhodoplanes sp. TaxID=1934341 RepID=UPI003D0B8252